VNSARKLRHIQALARSPGWKIVEQVMRDEIVTLALKTAKTPKKTNEESAYYAGTLQAAENLLNIVANLEIKLQGEAKLEEFEAEGKTENFFASELQGDHLTH
tara:strand:+ start:88 stop:396 length:309 start_codon:yes stop_codon:yes gene_type:complete